MTKVFLNSTGLIMRNGIDYSQLVDAIKNGEHCWDIDDLSLSSFNAAKELGDRRLLRAIATKDIYGLLALERCEEVADIDPERMAMFIGAQIPTASDNRGYMRAVETSGQEEQFGGNINLAHPMTLLTSLANNVLCYAAIKRNARGVNNNYTNMETSSIVALINAVLSIKNNKADAAYVGGYSSLTNEKSDNAMFLQQGFATTDKSSHRPLSGESSGTRLADGAVFITLSKNDSVVELIGGDTCHDGSGPFSQESEPQITLDMIQNVLERNELSMSDLGALFLSGHGARKTDELEMKLTESIKTHQKNLRVYSAGSFTGNLAEAGGILELALSETMINDSSLRASLSLQGDEALPINPYILHVRTGVWGDHSCVLTKVKI